MDYAVLQEEIRLLEDWSITNHLNVSKSVASPWRPFAKGGVLQIPGIILLISSNMSWLMHITATCSKAKQILGLLYRHFYGSASPGTLK